MNKKKFLSKLMDVPYLVVAGALYAVAYTMFLVPGNVFTGGIGGLATVWHNIYGLPTGPLIFALNVPLIIAFAVVYG